METPIGNYQKGWLVVASSSERTQRGARYLGKSRRPQDRSVLTASAGTGEFRVLNGARGRLGKRSQVACRKVKPGLLHDLVPSR